jgi:hypothetical protein
MAQLPRVVVCDVVDALLLLDEFDVLAAVADDELLVFAESSDALSSDDVFVDVVVALLAVVWADVVPLAHMIPESVSAEAMLRLAASRRARAARGLRGARRPACVDRAGTRGPGTASACSSGSGVGVVVIGGPSKWVRPLPGNLRTRRESPRRGG